MLEPGVATVYIENHKRAVPGWTNTEVNAQD